MRLGKFELEVEPTKTRVVECGRFAVQHAKAKGERPEPFDFLGVTHYCGTRRDGKGFRMKRMTARKKLTAKLHAFKEWLKKARTQKTKELWETAVLGEKVCSLKEYRNEIIAALDFLFTGF